MLSLKFVRDQWERVAQSLADRGQTLDMTGFHQAEERRRRLLVEVENLRGERNRVSEEVARRKKAREDAADLIAAMKEVGARIKALDEELAGIETQLEELVMVIPNIPHESVPRGACAEENPVVRTWGQPPAFGFTARPHWEIGESLGILDFERAAKVTGARFAVYRGDGARLERALISFMLDLHTARHGYTEILPPFMVNRESLVGTGQLPKFESELFRMRDDEWYLVPTAEVPVTNLHRDEIIPGEQLPLRYVAFTPCFRREAGSHGKDTRGLIRQHQFNKVELVQFARPEESYAQLERLTADAEEVLRQLGIPYRVVTLCTGDMGFSSAKTYDIEAWLPGQETYREISSCSNFEDYQARRARIRYRPAGGGKAELVHTLNGSGLAVGRTVVAVLENCQQEDGTVRVPEALVPYMGGRTVLKRS